MRVKLLRAMSAMTVWLLLMGLTSTVSAAQAEPTSSGYFGPYDDGCYYYLDTSVSGYTERDCPRADKAYDIFVPLSNGNWDYWGTGLWLDSGSFAVFSNAGYYGPANGCSYYWDGYRILENACPRGDGWYSVSEYDPASGTWTYAAESIWYDDGSQEIVFLNGVTAYLPGTGEVLFLMTNGSKILVKVDGSMVGQTAQGDYILFDSSGQVIQEGNVNSAGEAQSAPEIPAPQNQTQSTSQTLYEYANEHPDDPNALYLFDRWHEAQSGMTELWTSPDCNFSSNGCF